MGLGTEVEEEDSMRRVGVGFGVVESARVGVGGDTGSVCEGRVRVGELLEGSMVFGGSKLSYVKSTTLTARS